MGCRLRAPSSCYFPCLGKGNGANINRGPHVCQELYTHLESTRKSRKVGVAISILRNGTEAQRGKVTCPWLHSSAVLYLDSLALSPGLSDSKSTASTGSQLHGWRRPWRTCTMPPLLGSILWLLAGLNPLVICFPYMNFEPRWELFLTSSGLP